MKHEISNDSYSYLVFIDLRRILNGIEIQPAKAGHHGLSDDS
jgi:hypothetical protein